MATFVLLYSGVPCSEDTHNPDEYARAWDDWYKWCTKYTGAIIMGSGFSPQTKTLTSDGQIRNDSALPIMGGYTILHTDSLDTAIEIAKDCPLLKMGTNVSIYETHECR